MPIAAARFPIGQTLQPVHGGQRRGGAQDRAAGAFPVGARAPLGALGALGAFGPLGGLGSLGGLARAVVRFGCLGRSLLTT